MKTKRKTKHERQRAERDQLDAIRFMTAERLAEACDDKNDRPGRVALLARAFRAGVHDKHNADELKRAHLDAGVDIDETRINADAAAAGVDWDPQTGRQQMPADRPVLSFDGCGINGPDEYRSRLCTFLDLNGSAKTWGPRFAASPELIAFAELVRKELGAMLPEMGHRNPVAVRTVKTLIGEANGVLAKAGIY